jgi:hypothetical protein
LATLVFHLNHCAVYQALAPRVFHSNRRDLATMFFHGATSSPVNVTTSFNQSAAWVLLKIAHPATLFTQIRPAEQS